MTGSKRTEQNLLANILQKLTGAWPKFVVHGNTHHQDDGEHEDGEDHGRDAVHKPANPVHSVAQTHHTHRLL